MSEVGELLELLHGASSRFERLHAHFRTWRHDEREEEASAAHEKANDIVVGVAALESGDDQDNADQTKSPEREGLSRIWVDGRDRLREESEGDDGVEITVRVGHRWWEYSDEDGAFSGDSGDLDPFDCQDLTWLVDPGRSIGLLDLEPRGRGMRAGREVVLAHARPRTSSRGSWLVEDLGEGADEYELEVDAERGVLLRVEARLNGLPFSILEAVRITFDEPISPETFTFEAPSGQAVQQIHGSGRSEFDLPIHEAVRRSPFGIFIPARVPDDWTLRVTFVEGMERPDIPTSVVVSYRSRDATAGLMIIETAHDGPLDVAEGPDTPAAEEIFRNGQRMHARARTSEWGESQITLTQDLTTIVMSSRELDVDALATLASSLVPAPEEPPRFD